MSYVIIDYNTIPLDRLKYIIDLVTKRLDYKTITIEEIIDVIKIMPFCVRRESSYSLEARIFGKTFCLLMDYTDFSSIKYTVIHDRLYNDMLNKQERLEHEIRRKVYNRQRATFSLDSSGRPYVVQGNTISYDQEDIDRIREEEFKKRLEKQNVVEVKEVVKKLVKQKRKILELKELNLNKVEL